MRGMLRSLVAAGFVLVFGSAASAVDTPIPFFGAVDLTDATDRAILSAAESSPCEGNDGGSPSQFILDPGCAVRANDTGTSIFEFDPADYTAGWALDATKGLYDLGLNVAVDLSLGRPASLTFSGGTATVTVAAAVWEPILKFGLDSPSLVTLTSGTVSDLVMDINIGTGDITSYSWTGNATTVLGAAALNVALLPGTTANYYSAEAASAPDADGAVVWACGTGGFIALPANTPGVDPGSLGTCPPDATNPSATVSNAAYDAITGAIYANASSAVLSITPRGWGPADFRLSEVPEPGTLLLVGSGLLGLSAFGRRRKG